MESWLYDIAWEPFSFSEREKGGPADTWLVVGSPGGAERDPQLMKKLSERGGTAIFVEVDTRDVGNALLAKKLSEKVGTLPQVTGVISLLPFAEEGHSRYPRVNSGTIGTLTLFQALLASGLKAPMWSLTRGAVSTGPGDPCLSPTQAQTWGLGQCIELEYASLWGGVIDLPNEWDELTGEYLMAALSDRAETQIAIRPGGPLRRRLVRVNDARPARQWRPRGTVLVTGGLGGLGGYVARWLVDQGARHLVLTGRRGSDTPGAEELRQELSQSGADVTIAACDMADREAIIALISSLEREGRPIRSVMHAAGVTQTTPIGATSPQELVDVYQAKVTGALILDELLAGKDLDAFVLFSSVAATWGVPMSGPYASANSFMDALAQRRRDRGETATSVAWGPWASGLMDNEWAKEKMRRLGMPLMAPESAVSALARTLDQDLTTVTVADVDWSMFLTDPAQRERHLFDRVNR